MPDESHFPTDRAEKKPFHWKWTLPPIFLYLIFGGYALKSYLGINLLKSVSLSAHIPFKYLVTKRIVDSRQMGAVFHDDFNHHPLGMGWGDVWMAKKETVTAGLGSNGGDGDRWMEISNVGPGNWSICTRVMIAVDAGDIIYMEGNVRVDGEAARAYFGVSAMDPGEKLLSHNLFREEIGSTGKWTHFEKRLVIPESVGPKSVGYIRFRFVGSGPGTSCFDDIRIVREGKGPGKTG